MALVVVLLALLVIPPGATFAPVGRRARAFLSGLDVRSRRVSVCGPVHTRRVCSHTCCKPSKPREGGELLPERASEDTLTQVLCVRKHPFSAARLTDDFFVTVCRAGGRAERSRGRQGKGQARWNLERGMRLTRCRSCTNTRAGPARLDAATRAGGGQCFQENAADRAH